MSIRKNYKRCSAKEWLIYADPGVDVQPIESTNLRGGTSGYSSAKAAAEQGEHYRVIGESLQICEAGSLRVGVPWLFPTQRVTSLRNSFEGSVEEFVRYNLVTVNTKALELYCEDLENLPLSSESDKSLCLKELTLIERYVFPVIVGVLFFCSFLVSVRYFSGQFAVAFFVGGAAGCLGLILGIVLCGQRVRRTSFRWILCREIMRRGGIDPDGKTGVRVCSA